MKNDERELLDNIQKLIQRRETPSHLQHLKKNESSHSKALTTSYYSRLDPAQVPASQALLSLITRLVELEGQVEEAGRRGTLVPLSEVGIAVKEARKRQGISTDYLADLSGVAAGTINKVEKGELGVQVSKLKQICNALGMELLVASS